MSVDVYYTNHALYVREVLGLRPAPEFEQWLQQYGLMDDRGKVLPAGATHRLLKGYV